MPLYNNNNNNNCWLNNTTESHNANNMCDLSFTKEQAYMQVISNLLRGLNSLLNDDCDLVSYQSP